MNKNIENLINSIQVPTEINYDDNECKFRMNIAQNYLSYEETIHSGKRSKQDSHEKIRDYTKVWGVRNTIQAILNELTESIEFGNIDIVSNEDEPDRVRRVLEKFNNKFTFDESETDIPKLTNMLNVLVDDIMDKELSDEGMEMVARDIWSSFWSPIG